MLNAVERAVLLRGLWALRLGAGRTKAGRRIIDEYASEAIDVDDLDGFMNLHGAITYLPYPGRLSRRVMGMMIDTMLGGDGPVGVYEKWDEELEDEDLFSPRIFFACQELWKLQPGDAATSLLIRCEAIVQKKAIVPSRLEDAVPCWEFKVTTTEGDDILLEDKRRKLPIVRDLENVGPFGRKAMWPRRDSFFQSLHGFAVELDHGGLIPSCDCDWKAITH